MATQRQLKIAASYLFDFVNLEKYLDSLGPVQKRALMDVAKVHAKDRNQKQREALALSDIDIDNAA